METIVTYTEEIKLDLKQVFILQEMNRINKDISWAWSEYNYLHCDYLNLERSMSKHFWGLSHAGLIEQCDDGSEWSYIRYRISKKGHSIFPQIKDVDTEFLQYLRPKKEK